MRPKPKRVAIIGGGCAGLSAAYELTRPELGGAYEVTVHQVGWRLGGKGASSRGPHDRIEEHGIHVWMGCYDNAFRMMRAVYDSLAAQRQGRPMADWREAFSPLPHVGLASWSPEHGWDVWSTYFPPLPGLPGDEGGLSGEVFSVRRYVIGCMSALATLIETAYASPSRHERAPQSEAEQLEWSTQVGMLERARRVIQGGLAGLRSPAQLHEAVRLMVAVLTGFTPGLHAVALALLDLIGRRAELFVGPPRAGDLDALHTAAVVELVVTCARGCLVDGLLSSDQGFDLVDEWDFRDWLIHHGASQTTVNSAFVHGMYSLMFAYRNGDPRRPCISAGVALRVCARMFLTYRGSLFWRMNAGMGEIVFAPLYQCLVERGVKFEFFHRLERVHTGAGVGWRGAPSSRVRSLEFTVQAQTITGRDYEPLIDVHGLPCWPNEPRWDQLEPGPRDNLEAGRPSQPGRARKLLVEGEDFDYVVLAVSVAEIPHVAHELLERHPEWQAMVDALETVATQALQLWLSPTMQELGWQRGPIMMTGFHSPFDSWTDMTGVLERETWPPEHRPGALAYFCNVLREVAADDVPAGMDYDEVMHRQVRANSIAFLDRQIGALWPAACSSEGFRWQLLTTGEQPSSADAHPIDTQYFRANCVGSERYVLSVPGSTKYRISPLDRHCDNLTIAGDWTECGINVGCIEAAVISGALAAHAITGTTPSCESLVGYHHP